MEDYTRRATKWTGVLNVRLVDHTRDEKSRTVTNESNDKGVTFNKVKLWASTIMNSEQVRMWDEGIGTSLKESRRHVPQGCKLLESPPKNLPPTSIVRNPAKIRNGYIQNKSLEHYILPIITAILDQCAGQNFTLEPSVNVPSVGIQHYT